MKTHCLMLAGLLLAGHAIAAIWTVDSNTARPADFRTLQEAHDTVAVADGDTLCLMPSTIGYGSLNLAKRLTLIGPGYLLNQNLPFSVPAPSALTGSINFYPGSSGSLVTGCEIGGYVQIVGLEGNFPNNLTIKRNFIHGTLTNSAASPSSGVQILQNHIVGDLVMGHAASGGLLVRGNFVGGSLNIGSDFNSGIVAHNVVNGDMFAGGSCLYENMLVRGKTWGLGTALIRNCWGESIGYWSGTPTFSNHVAWTDELTFVSQFVGSGSLDARWQLKTDAAVRGQGFGGVDPGHTAGPDPYVISGLPSVPMVKGILAPSSASAASGLPITVELQVNP